MRLSMQWIPCLLQVATILVPLCTSEDSCVAGAGSQCRTPPSSTVSAGSKPAKVQAQATADLITQEVDQLKRYMGLCKERIELLEDLNRTVKSGRNLAMPESHLRLLQERLPLMSEISFDEDRAPISSADDYLVLKAIIPSEEPVRFVKFLPLRNMRTSGPTPMGQSVLPTSILVTVQEDGGVRLFTPSAEMVLSFSAGHEHDVTNLAVSPSHDEYFITTADAGGILRVHKVNVRQRRLNREQREKKRRNQTDEKLSQYLGSQVNVTAQFTKQMRVPNASDGRPPRFTALTVASQQGSKYFVVGDDEGRISVFTRNGTFRAKINVSISLGDRISGLFAHLSNLIFIVGNDWGFLDLETLEVKRMECPRFEGHVTTAVVDSHQSSRVIVADEHGTVWVFNIKEKKSCKVEHRFPKIATAAPIELASVRGFTIGLEQSERGTSVLALNMSHVGKRKDAPMDTRSAVVWRKDRPVVRDWSLHKRYQQGDLLAFLSEDGYEIEVFELLMQVYQAPSSENFGNYKMPVVAVAIVLVIGFQYFRSKGGESPDFNSPEFAALRKGKKFKGGLGKRGKKKSMGSGMGGGFDGGF